MITNNVLDDGPWMIDGSLPSTSLPSTENEDGPWMIEGRSLPSTESKN